MAEKQKFMFKCLNCEEEFNSPNFQCADGRDHVVAAKTYYSASAELLTYVTPEKVIYLKDGSSDRILPRKVRFLRGAYSTQDPVEQFGLNNNPVLISTEEWRRRFLTNEDQLHMANQEANAKSNRLEEENNKLLEQVKQLQSGKARASA